MKTILLILLSLPCMGQIPILEAKHPYYGIILKADTTTVKKGFEHLNKVCGLRLWKYHRYVIKNDTTYVQMALMKKVYRIEGKKYIRAKEYEL